MEKGKEITIGKLGKFHFPKGFYIYVGSAKNGIEKRVGRHLRKNKKMRWHIDYFLKDANIIDVYVSEKEECETAKFFEEYGKIIAKGFGSSDCHCISHLFYFKDYPPIPPFSKKWVNRIKKP